MNKVKLKISDILYRFRIASKIFLNPKTGYYLFKPDEPNQIKVLNLLGQKRSMDEKKPIDKDGNPIPWFTYPMIEYLSQIDFSNFDVLEWGCGNSTLFFAQRCKSIKSIEHNKEWYEKIVGKLPSNSKLVLANGDKYAALPMTFNEKYDLIIVDGIMRFECLRASLKLVSKKGIIIFDNSERDPDHCKFLRDRGFIQIDFHGFGPINNYTWTTSIFLSRKIDLRPIDKQPCIPKGGGY